MIRQIPTLLTAIFLLLLTACQTASPDAQQQEVPPGLDLSLMDTSVNAAADFYRFVNGGWLDQVEIPADEDSWGAFDELAKATSKKVLTILESTIEQGNFDPNTDQGKAVLFYQTAMDTAHIEELGLNPIETELRKIEAISSLKELETYLIESAPLQSNAFFSFSVRPSLNNSAINAGFLNEGALGLPGKEYYVKDDEETLRLQREYQAFVSRVLQLAGAGEQAAQKEAEDIFQLEKRLADAQLDKIQKRNPLLLNNPHAQSDIAAMTPSFDWEAYFQSIGLGSIDTFIVMQPAYIKSLENVLAKQPLDKLKSYTRWTLLNSALAYLSRDFEQANFDFYKGVLGGVEEMSPRWERVLNTTNFGIGEALGKLYVDAYFPPEAKQVAEELVDNLKKAYAERIQKLEWMSDSTKVKAQEKLANLRVKIGYPDEWKDYSQLEVKGKEDGGSFAGNMMNVSRWSWERKVEKVGQPVDKGEWFLPPQVVNAYYHPLYNEIVFPAAILQPPYYNYQADPAVNYGGIGAVIGHEISHGFDDQGSRYDAQGNLKNWWTEEDRSRFEARTQRLVDQFNAYEPLPGLFVNGEFTLGENIGDLGGLNVAFDGLQKHLQEHGNPGPIDGFTQNQRFFLSWGTVWRSKYRDEAMKKQVKTNVHAPGQYRAIGPIVNMPAFYEAFNIGEDSPLYRADSVRVVIW
ncbi:MAG: M13 family metallopeptidase [Phaeodactylibacter sp.]|nr:M13 family metallopeptidase [Phaeodactylibacter sp.]MCB9049714.1 M13 family metallopeptidase [Lewinellaceae bacterium]